MSHRCDDTCRCPEHGRRMFYVPMLPDHCCPVAGCGYTMGMVPPELTMPNATGLAGLPGLSDYKSGAARLEVEGR